MRLYIINYVNKGLPERGKHHALFLFRSALCKPNKLTWNKWHLNKLNPQLLLRL